MDWDPRYLYRQVFDAEKKINWFLQNVCTPEWNQQMDAGKPFEEAVKEKSVEFPEYKYEIQLYHSRWIEMIRGSIAGTVNVLYDLKNNGYTLFGLTNWSAETFPLVRNNYAFFDELDGIIVSGEEGVAKPDQAIYSAFLERFNLMAAECIFIDDNLNNINSADQMGFNTIRFFTPEQLVKDLKAMGIQL